MFSFFLCFLKGDYFHETECMNIKLQDCLMFISTLKMNFIPPFFLEILQRCCTCYSGYFGHVWLLPLKRWYQLAENFNIYFLPKNQIYSFPLSWNIAKMLKTCYFFQKIILTCRKLWFLSTCFKSRYYWKNPEILLAKSILVYNLRNRILPDKELLVKYNNVFFFFQFRLSPGKINEKIFQKCRHTDRPKHRCTDGQACMCRTPFAKAGGSKNFILFDKK